MSDIRESPENDIALADGDIVMVQSGPVRTAWVGFWSGLSRAVMLGFRPIVDFPQNEILSGQL